MGINPGCTSGPPQCCSLTSRCRAVTLRPVRDSKLAMGRGDEELIATRVDGSTPLRLPDESVGGTANIVAFIAIVLLLGTARLLTVWEPLQALAGISTVAAALSPLVAALGIAALTRGRAGLSDLWRRATHWRIPLRWYLLGLVVPVVVYGTVLAVQVAFGDARLRWGPAVSLVVLEIVLTGPFFYFVEEIGWRGWLQRALQVRLSGLVAGLSVGAVWFLWHLPLSFIPGTVQSEFSVVAYMALTLPAALIFAWIYNATGGSVPAVVAAHFGFNLGTGGILSALSEGANAFIAFSAIPTIVAAVLVAVIAGPSLGVSPAHHRPTERIR